MTISVAGPAHTRSTGILGRLLDETEAAGEVEQRGEALTIGRHAESRTLTHRYEARTRDAHDSAAIKAANPATWITEAWLAAPRRPGLAGQRPAGRAVCAGGCCRGREGQGDGARGTPSGTRARLTVMNPQLRAVVGGLVADGAQVWEAGRPLHEPEDAEPREEQQPRREPPPRPATAEEAPPEQETEPQEAAGELLSAEEEEPLPPEAERKLEQLGSGRGWRTRRARIGHSSPEFRRRHLTNLRRNVARTLKPRPILPVPAATGRRAGLSLPVGADPLVGLGSPGAAGAPGRGPAPAQIPQTNPTVAMM